MMATELLDGVWLQDEKRATTTTTVLALGATSAWSSIPRWSRRIPVEVSELTRGRWTVTLGWSTHRTGTMSLVVRLGAEVVRFATRSEPQLCAVERGELEAYLEASAPATRPGSAGS